MKTILTFFMLLLSTSVFAQEQLTVFYFGASDCGPCNRPDVIESIDEIRAGFDSLHPGYDTKLVMVAMDEDLDVGLEYTTKYEKWDEISIGSRYHNENTLAHLNNIMIPGVPHIIIYKDSFKKGDFGVEVIKDRELVKNILSGEEIVAWVDNDMPLD